MREKVAFLLAASVATFVVLSLVAIFILAFFSDSDVGEQWGALFALMTAVLGGVTGWLGGTASEQRKQIVQSDIDVVRPTEDGGDGEDFYG